MKLILKLDLNWLGLVDLWWPCAESNGSMYLLQSTIESLDPKTQKSHLISACCFDGTSCINFFSFPSSLDVALFPPDLIIGYHDGLFLWAANLMLDERFDTMSWKKRENKKQGVPWCFSLSTAYNHTPCPQGTILGPMTSSVIVQIRGWPWSSRLSDQTLRQPFPMYLLLPSTHTREGRGASSRGPVGKLQPLCLS